MSNGCSLLCSGICIIGSCRCPDNYSSLRFADTMQKSVIYAKPMKKRVIYSSSIHFPTRETCITFPRFGTIVIISRATRAYPHLIHKTGSLKNSPTHFRTRTYSLGEREVGLWWTVYSFHLFSLVWEVWHVTVLSGVSWG